MVLLVLSFWGGGGAFGRLKKASKLYTRDSPHKARNIKNTSKKNTGFVNNSRRLSIFSLVVAARYRNIKQGRQILAHDLLVEALPLFILVPGAAQCLGLFLILFQHRVVPRRRRVQHRQAVHRSSCAAAAAASAAAAAATVVRPRILPVQGHKELFVSPVLQPPVQRVHPLQQLAVRPLRRAGFRRLLAARLAVCLGARRRTRPAEAHSALVGDAAVAFFHARLVEDVSAHVRDDVLRLRQGCLAGAARGSEGRVACGDGAHGLLRGLQLRLLQVVHVAGQAGMEGTLQAALEPGVLEDALQDCLELGKGAVRVVCGDLLQDDHLYPLGAL
eukprot:Rhum_TRINITY_DN14517_c10_g1::Rhum_TRINITY_DN14517_c10_g1_i1::g.95307::m.95307